MAPIKFSIVLLFTITMLSCDNNKKKCIDETVLKESAEKNIPIDANTTNSEAYLEAIEDFNNDSAKYYMHTISIAPQDFVDTAKHYNIKVITSSCTPSYYETEYNKGIEDAFQQQYGMSFVKLQMGS